MTRALVPAYKLANLQEGTDYRLIAVVSPGWVLVDLRLDLLLKAL